MIGFAFDAVPYGLFVVQMSDAVSECCWPDVTLLHLSYFSADTKAATN